MPGEHFFKTAFGKGAKLHVVVFKEQRILFICVCVVIINFSKDVPLKFSKSVLILLEQQVEFKKF